MNILTAINKFLMYKDEDLEGTEMTVAGRVLTVRCLGKLTFITIGDLNGRIQIALRGKQKLPEMWDICEFTGKLQRTKAGEPTIWADTYITHATCDGDLPEKFHGLKDIDKRYRNRHVDLIINEDTKKILRFRAIAIREIRTILDEQGYLEIETPTLQSVAAGANASSFETRSDLLSKDLFLRIATEVPLKKALIGGFEKVFEIGKSFRNEGLDLTHNPEFTELEIYKAFGDLNDMKALIRYIVTALSNISSMYQFDMGNPEWSFPEYEYDDLIEKYGEDYEKHLINPCFVVGHPIDDVPFCKAREDGKADRFEFYWNGMEIADAYNELVDWKTQEERLGGAEDDGLVEAMKYGMPPTGGMGVGIDRLIMCLTGQSSIREVMMFPMRK